MATKKAVRKPNPRKRKPKTVKDKTVKPEAVGQDGLTDKQRVFIEQYLICWNASEAARRAGYSEKTAYSIGSENLRKPEIRRPIDQRLAEMAMSSEEVVARLTLQARGDLHPFLAASGEAIDLTTDPAKQNLAIIKKFRVKKRRGGKSDDPWEEVDTEIELYDAQSALVQLGRYHGIFTDRISGEIETLTPEQLEQRRKERWEKAAPLLAAVLANKTQGEAPTDGS